MVFRSGIRSIRSWIVVYAGFIAAIVFAESGVAMTFPEPEAVSPVLISADRPSINVETLVRRSDI